jgi:hypothetical protein
MNTNLVLTIVKNVIDICLVWLVLYYILRILEIMLK